MSRYTNRVAGLTLVPSSGGVFEVSVGNELVYSKMKTGTFPNEAQLVEEIGTKL